MAQNFTINTRQFDRAIREMPNAVARGAKTAMGDIKDDWILVARDLAPKDTGNLRRQIDGEVQGSDLNTLVVEMHGNATQSQKRDSGGSASGDDFNYGYYIHELDAGGKNLRTPGTVKKFFDESAAQREGTWQQWLEQEIEDELRDAGWR